MVDGIIKLLLSLSYFTALKCPKEQCMYALHTYIIVGFLMGSIRTPMGTKI